MAYRSYVILHIKKVSNSILDEKNFLEVTMRENSFPHFVVEVTFITICKLKVTQSLVSLNSVC